ncbi:MAG: adenine deaminase [Gammaproteobacteria bacterium RIFOXYA12_FULL_61_12]|nr:MAG: adenine deaminase [Gammaproteobacteria bacterium RIFOXYD12_FULL_61_37]OGT93441.1 MAG: adenine deaminase [Gammaproteobacteria bacterium RIFOXYA12_FULL_61_12]
MENLSGTIKANIVDLEAIEVCFGGLHWRDGVITRIEPKGDEEPRASYLIPGFVDAHVHIESSMLTPSEFGRMALRHGTLGAVSDPHEIANVLGMEGVRFMLSDAAQSPFPIAFGAPSCVPATPFETAGSLFGLEEIELLLAEPQIGYLSEMMNFPGVLARDAGVMAKIAAALRLGMPVDGHAPGLRGEEARRYAEAGIGTDHECFSLEEARDKIAAGMSILIREGSAARNFDALHPLISEYPGRVMFCSDDKHPDDLLLGHMDRLAARAVALGHDPFDVLRCACLNPVRHYRLPLGQLRPGDSMDALLVQDLREFRPLTAWLRGRRVMEAGNVLLPHHQAHAVNRFNANPLDPAGLRVRAEVGRLRVIDALDGELITHESWAEPKVEAGFILPDPVRDLLQLCVINRYQPAPPALGFIRGFGLKRGALASSVAHDSHNLIAVGTDPESLAAALNALISAQGGIAVADGTQVELMPLPIAGLMSNREGPWVAERYAGLDRRAKALGSPLRAPFMTLSFMALLVIPELKLSDKGLFDGRSFSFTALQG